MHSVVIEIVVNFSVTHKSEVSSVGNKTSLFEINIKFRNKSKVLKQLLII